MLNVTHLVTLGTIGVLLSGAIAMITEWIVKNTAWGISRQKHLRKWLPIYIGVPCGIGGFPLSVHLVVGPLDMSEWWLVVGWGVFGLLLGISAGTGAWFAYDIARAWFGSKVGK